MRSKKEVQEEIDWREKEIESIRLEMKNNAYDERHLHYMQSRLTNLTLALTWCKWFLKID